MVRARYSDSWTEMSKVTARTIASVWRASRTAWVMSGALRVVSSSSPVVPTRVAAVMIGLSSGAVRSRTTAPPNWPA